MSTSRSAGARGSATALVYLSQWRSLRLTTYDPTSLRARTKGSRPGRVSMLGGGKTWPRYRAPPPPGTASDDVLVGLVPPGVSS